MTIRKMTGWFTIFAVVALLPITTTAQTPRLVEAAEDAMLRSSKYMVDKVSTNGRMVIHADRGAGAKWKLTAPWFGCKGRAQ